MRPFLAVAVLALLGCVTTPAAGPGQGGDRDTDGDGIFDAKDECPDAPEEKDGDGDGCPEVPQIVLEGGRIAIRGKIVFAVNSAELGPKNGPLLDALAKLLKETTQVKRVEVQGHTDDTGDTDFNLQLSVQRAERVKQELARRGVDAGRLSVKGLGESEPVADNDTPEGRARNRRVELHVLE